MGLVKLFKEFKYYYSCQIIKQPKLREILQYIRGFMSYDTNY